MTFQQTLANLARSDFSIANPELAELSDLSQEESKDFGNFWDELDTENRRKLLEQLIEMAEDNIEYNFDRVFRYALRDGDAFIRQRAIEGLWESEDVTLINELIRLIERDSAENVRLAAINGLNKFALMAEVKRIRSEYKPRIAHALLNMTENAVNSTEIRAAALVSVSPLSFPGVKEAIEKQYGSDNALQKIAAVTAMGHNCDTEWLPVLIGELLNIDANFRCAAAEAVGELGEQEAVPYLIKLVDDPDSEVALVAIEALGKIGGKEAKAKLKILLDDPEELVRQIAGEAIQEIEAEENPFSLGIQTYDDTGKQN